jgi:hypothetical protein
MDDALKQTATNLLAAAPASVEMPAGAGKTHLLAAAVAVASSRDSRSLVLTHTHAGVDAIRKRLQQFGVPPHSVRVETITSWAFSLAGAYPRLGQVTVSDIPDWSQSDSYVEGAARVARTGAIADVHSVSFDYVFVDEYQDCTLLHHDLVLAIAAAVPRTIVLGDRLQAIFGFAGALAGWDSHVVPHFAPFVIDHKPQRWKGHNEALGAWLLEIRPQLVEGRTFDLSQHSVPGVSMVMASGTTNVATVAHGFTDFNESVVLLDKWPKSVARHASRLGGSYSVMEDISGNFMRQQLAGDPGRGVLGLPASGDPALARWFAQFAKECVVGLSGVDNTVLNRLTNSKSLLGISREGIQPVIDALEHLRSNPTYEQVALSAETIRGSKSLKVYRWEAWLDTLQAIAMCTQNEASAVDNLAQIRERLRRQGRRKHSRVASRTLLVKGLEYDHVVIADFAQMSDPRNLYVALSRARKSVTIVGPRPHILLVND